MDSALPERKTMILEEDFYDSDFIPDEGDYQIESE